MKLHNKKTGEIIDLEVGRITDSGYGSAILLSPVAAINESYTYSSLAELCEEWEDYEEKEPLIKDEEIREIIRAWANVNDALAFKYNYDENSLDDIYRNTISFNMGLGLKDDGKYTITELCGEEEE